MRGMIAMALIIAVAAAIMIDGRAVWGEQHESAKSEYVQNADIQAQIFEEQYRQFGHTALYKYFMQKAEYYNQTNKLSQVRPISPYNSWFGAGMYVVGNGLGILPTYSRRIDDRSFYQIRMGFTTLWHPYMRFREPGSYGYRDYGTTFLVPMLFSYKRYWGENHPRKRVYPYFAAGAGPVLGMNLPADGSPYDPAYSKFAMRVGPAAFAGTGVNIVLTRRYWLTLEGRYEVQYFPSSLGPRHNYSSPAFFVGISRGFFL